MAQKHGMSFGDLVGESKTFKGLGDAKALGKRPCFISIEAYDTLEAQRDNKCFPTSLMDATVLSHEILDAP